MPTMPHTRYVGAASADSHRVEVAGFTPVRIPFTACPVAPVVCPQAAGFTHSKIGLRKLAGSAATTGLALYWSASAYANNSNNAWIVNFNNGNETNNNKNNSRYVRLVRAGE